MAESPTIKPIERPTACPVCGSSALTTASKTIDASTYWHCAACGEIWNAGRRQVAAPRSYWR